MVDDLGEVRVQVEQEGAQEAADTIADATGESQEEGMGGGAAGDGGTIAELLGGIGSKLAAVLGIVGVLSALKPIQELLSGLVRALSVAILPLVALLKTFLKPILRQLLGLIGGLDLQTTFDEFLTRAETLLRSTWNDAVKALINALNQIPGVNINEGGGPPSPSESGFNQRETTVPGVNAGDLSSDPFPILGDVQQGANDVYVSLFGEQSNTNMNQNATETTNKETTRNGLGGLFP